MRRYTEEQKQAIVERMLPPRNEPVSALVRETGISDSRLYTWRKQARAKGVMVAGKRDNPERWSSAQKFAVVLETAALNEMEISA